MLNEMQREEVLSLAQHFPRLWRDPRVSHRERKRMVRLLIEDVTLLRGEQVSIGICFRGGATRSLTIPAPLPPYRTWQTPPEIVAQIDRLLDQHTEGEIAAQLNAQGCAPARAAASGARSLRTSVAATTSRAATIACEQRVC